MMIRTINKERLHFTSIIIGRTEEVPIGIPVHLILHFHQTFDFYQLFTPVNNYSV